MRNEWKEFVGGRWETEIDVRDFIMRNYTPYDGDESFLKGPTADTTALWQQVLELSKKEREAGGVLDMDTKTVSTILSHGPGYLDKEKEKIVGFQTDKPFKRAMMPYGGIRMANQACEDNQYNNNQLFHDKFLLGIPHPVSLAYWSTHHSALVHPDLHYVMM